MKKRTPHALSLALLTVLAVAPQARAQVFHKYVALGDSLTSGVEGGCLVARHQTRSYPKLIADAIGITDFQQPIVNEKALTSPLTGTACLGATLSGTNISAGPVSRSPGR